MSVPGDITRKVRQLDHDVQAIYEMLARLEATQQRHGNRLTELADTLAEHDAKLDSQGAKLDAILEILRTRG